MLDLLRESVNELLGPTNLLLARGWSSCDANLWFGHFEPGGQDEDATGNHSPCNVSTNRRGPP